MDEVTFRSGPAPLRATRHFRNRLSERFPGTCIAGVLAMLREGKAIPARGSPTIYFVLGFIGREECVVVTDVTDRRLELLTVFAPSQRWKRALERGVAVPLEVIVAASLSLVETERPPLRGLAEVRLVVPA